VRVESAACLRPLRPTSYAEIRAGARSTPRCSGTCPNADGASTIAHLGMYRSLPHQLAATLTATATVDAYHQQALQSRPVARLLLRAGLPSPFGKSRGYQRVTAPMPAAGSACELVSLIDQLLGPLE
jgi:hypothetical protein